MISATLPTPCRPICWPRNVQPHYADFRAGDVQHSQADITKAVERLGYRPTHRVGEGLAQAMEWYMMQVKQNDQVLRPAH